MDDKAILRKKNELAKIHIAKSWLKMDDETYRAVLKRVINADIAKNITLEGEVKMSEGVISAKYLTSYGRAALLEYFKKLGFSGDKEYPGRPKNIDSTTAGNALQLKKIEALLAEADRPWAYAISMAKRMYKKDRLEFCSSGELTGIISGLMKNAAKEGRRTT